MPVNETLAHNSTYAYTAAVTIYVLSMFFYLAEQAFGKKVAKAKAKPAKARQLVTAGGTTVTTSAVPDDDPVDTGTPGNRPLAERLGRMGVALTVLGAIVHLASIVLRGLAVHRWPLGNMYEFMSFVCLIAVAAWLILLRRFQIRRLGAFVLIPVFILMFLGGTVLYTQAEPVQPALQSYWLVIHVTVVSTACGILLVPGVASVMFLIRGAYDRNPEQFTRIGSRLPSTATLDRLAYRTTIFGFPLFTFGVICGAIWAESAWGRFWGWDPKETTAFVAWVVYAAYLHSRATAGWRGNRAAIINIVGFAVMIFNLFFINLVTTGLHSYAGVG
ncbi:MAG TPA: c-type cytochrome biogenesis protein CcsB [Pseudonocardiaceae bacterium]|jgi:cytochrome c-type biogenesis protein CcsB|nr:c-type cytochrome biogenesis protein CcsB [Pseudonocardiaceae bacterium]